MAKFAFTFMLLCISFGSHASCVSGDLKKEIACLSSEVVKLQRQILEIQLKEGPKGDQGVQGIQGPPGRDGRTPLVSDYVVAYFNSEVTTCSTVCARNSSTCLGGILTDKNGETATCEYRRANTVCLCRK